MDVVPLPLLSQHPDQVGLPVDYVGESRQQGLTQGRTDKWVLCLLPMSSEQTPFSGVYPNLPSSPGPCAVSYKKLAPRGHPTGAHQGDHVLWLSEP